MNHNRINATKPKLRAQHLPTVTVTSMPYLDGRLITCGAVAESPSTMSRATSPSDLTGSRSKKRASNPKVRTGCLTCKKRHVKCDEAKPKCTRCERALIPCEGYVKPVTAAEAKANPKKPIIRPLLPRPRPIEAASLAPTPSPSPILFLQPSSRFLEGEDAGHFDFFQQHVVPFLAQTRWSDFWTITVLRDSTTEPTIKHSILALGALSRSFYRLEPSTPGGPTYIDEKYHKAALRHNAQAMTSFRLRMLQPDAHPRVALITALLLLAFELTACNLHRADSALCRATIVMDESAGMLQNHLFAHGMLPHGRHRHPAVVPGDSYSLSMGLFFDYFWKSQERMLPYLALVSGFAAPEMTCDQSCASYDDSGLEFPDFTLDGGPDGQSPTSSTSWNEIKGMRRAFSTRCAEFVSRHLWMNSANVPYDIEAARDEQRDTLELAGRWCQFLASMGTTCHAALFEQPSESLCGLADGQHVDTRLGEKQRRVCGAAFITRCLDRDVLEYEGFDVEMRALIG